MARRFTQKTIESIDQFHELLMMVIDEFLEQQENGPSALLKSWPESFSSEENLLEGHKKRSRRNH